MVKIITFCSLIILSFSYCTKDNFRERHPIVVSSCDTAGVISYATHIKPVLDNNCTTNCHNGIGSGHSLTAWNAVNADAVAGLLYGSVSWNGTAQQMPQGAANKISDCDITKIKKWAAAGAPNN
ncbi:MAG: hypothetical protein SFY56_10660 [Bacteroidota bacterium]|nr:hypothetical protein [Bacteroidota bacterium]